MAMVAVVRAIAVKTTTFTNLAHGVAVFVPGGTVGMPAGTGMGMLGATLADAHVVVTMIAMETTPLELVSPIAAVMTGIGLRYVHGTGNGQTKPQGGGKGDFAECLHVEYLSDV